MGLYRMILACDYSFPSYKRVEPAAEDFVRKLLVVSPAARLGGSIRGGRDVKAHAFFAELNSAQLVQRALPPPFVPSISSALDMSNYEQTWNDDEDDQPAALNTEYWNSYNTASNGRLFAEF